MNKEKSILDEYEYRHEMVLIGQLPTTKVVGLKSGD